MAFIVIPDRVAFCLNFVQSADWQHNNRFLNVTLTTKDSLSDKNKLVNIRQVYGTGEHRGVRVRK